MVTVEQLEALDLLMWFRSGAAAAFHCQCDESSITRRVRSGLKTLGLSLQRGAEFRVSGQLRLLRLQRLVHQQARFIGFGSRPLRLEATHYIRQYLRKPDPNGWILGPCHHRGYAALLSMLQDRIIDAWITSDLFDLPEDPSYTVIPLWSWPGELVVHPCHPLAGEQRLSNSDIERFPSLILPSQLYPGLAQQVHSKNLGHRKQLERYDKGSWHGMTDDAVTISYGSCLTLAVDSCLERLDWDLGLSGGEALIILSEWANEPAISMLLDHLRIRISKVQSKMPQLATHL